VGPVCCSFLFQFTLLTDFYSFTCYLSNSKDFVDTLSLAQHTVMSSKGSFRAEHLGLHKALCVLMGWNSAGFPNSQWVRQILPEVEASSLKEDLIIWPPVVVIHNRSIANDNPDERIIVSVEGLRHILRGKWTFLTDDSSHIF